MLKDITIGQFYPADSIIHQLDARIKIIATLVFVIMLFVIDSFVGYGFVFLSLWAVIVLSKVPVSMMVKGLKSILFILVFTAVINLFATQGETVLFQLWIFKATKEGLILSIQMVIRLIYLIVGSSIMTLTTTPIQLTDAIEYLLKPLKKIGVPAHEIAMMMTIALRFIPTLLDETDKIMKAQQARGADFETGSLIHRAKNMIPILVPVFAFRRADELAIAMEARCYHGDTGRTRMTEMKYSRLDYMAIGCLIVYCVLIIIVRIVF